MSIKIWVLTLLPVICGNLYCMDYPQMPAQVKQILDTHPDAVKDFVEHCKKMPTAKIGMNVLQPDWLPGHLIKYGIERVSNREKLHRIIDTYQLNLLAVPHKYLYHISTRPERVTDQNYIIISEKIEGINGANQNLTLQQTQQLWKLAITSGHCDLYPSNYISTPEGKIFIIDTDNSAMPRVPKNVSIAFSASVKKNSEKQYFSPEACQWLADTLKSHNAPKLPAKRRQ